MTLSTNDILSVGVPLHNHGINDWILTKDQALKILYKCYELKVSVYGGDVYYLYQNMLHRSFHNWYCDQEKYESDKEYLSRSIEYSIQYIEYYKNDKYEAIFFALIPPLITELLSSVGVSLSAQGINNWALDKGNAIKILEKFKQLGIPALGGDVLFLDSNKFDFTYDNWSYDESDGESKSEYCNNSI
ncbi:MAG: Imm40 family immunity protein, partial [Pseudomonadota bacterium]